jgi:hypothetical protein
MKAEADRHFLVGINQLIGHGWPYTAPALNIRAGDFMRRLFSTKESLVDCDAGRRAIFAAREFHDAAGSAGE